MLGQAQEQTIPIQDITVRKPEEMPRESISCISWSPNEKNPTFATSDWDSYIRIYHVSSDPSALVQKGCFPTERPCLSVTWSQDETKLFAGCTDGSVKSFDVESGKSDLIGFHEGPVQSVHWLAESNLLLTLSSDKTLRLWDPRQQEKHIAGYQLDYKPYCSDLMSPYLAVGMSESKMLILNMNEIQSTLGTRSVTYLDSPFGDKTQLTCIKFFRGFGIGVGNNHGVCNISRLEIKSNSEFERHRIMTFKAHQPRESGKAGALYPMNSIGFFTNGQFVFTAGGDGKMNFYDFGEKSQIAEFDFKGTPVTKAQMDPTGQFLVYSLGYDWSRGIQGYQSHHSRVCVHVMQDHELSRKASSEIKYPIKYSS